MMINRKIAPEVLPIEKLRITEPELIKEDGDFKFYYLENKSFDGFKLDLYFDAGYKHNTRLESKIASNSLFLGTSNRKEEDIENEFDLLGSFKGTEVSADYSSVSFLGSNNNFSKIVEIALEVISNNKINEKSFQQLISSQKQTFKVNQEKVSVKARNLFINKLYTSTHLEKTIALTDYDNVKCADIQRFIDKNFKKGLLKVTLTGNVSDEQLQELSNHLKPLVCNTKKDTSIIYKHNAGKFHEIKEEAVQSALRVGRMLFNRNHEDYPKFMFLNTLLGGYFGSRLMSTLREEKGLTYGVGSGVAQSEDHGYFFISTEVKKENHYEAIDIIKAEIEKLQSELVSDEEIEKVKNYLVGNLLKNSDGPFAQMSKFMAVENMGLDLTYYDRLLQTYQDIKPEEVKEIANRYLKWEDLLICSVG